MLVLEANATLNKDMHPYSIAENTKFTEMTETQRLGKPSQRG